MLSTHMNGHPLAYLDNGATTQKPQSVIDAITHFYRDEYATIHRGVYELSQKATQACDDVRAKTAQFIHAPSIDEIIFVRGTTEAINLVSHCLGAYVQPGQDVIITGMEHHANFVPWQMLCIRNGANFKVIPITDTGELDMDAYAKALSENTAIVAFGHISNALGTINPVQEMTMLAKKAGALVLIDGAQAIAHAPVDVQAIGCDFYAFSAHKCYGPTGIGVLWGKKTLLEAMPPYQFGGDMIESVSINKTTFAPIPAKFESGTPAIAEIIGLGAAFDYITKLGFDFIQKQEHSLLIYAQEQFEACLPCIQVIGKAKHKASLVSFIMEGVHPHDIGTILDQEGIAVRAGHHCAQPVMTRFGIPATTRASMSFYNTQEEIDRLVNALEKAYRLLG